MQRNFVEATIKLYVTYNGNSNKGISIEIAIRKKTRNTELGIAIKITLTGTQADIFKWLETEWKQNNKSKKG